MESQHSSYRIASEELTFPLILLCQIFDSLLQLTLDIIKRCEIVGPVVAKIYVCLSPSSHFIHHHWFAEGF